MMGQLTEIVAIIGTPVFMSGFLAVSIKAAVLLIAALAVTTMLRRAPASSRHQVWTLALAAVLALPALGLILPAWQVAMLPPDPAVVSPAPASDFLAQPGDAIGNEFEPARVAREQHDADAPVAGPTEAPPRESVPAEAPPHESVNVSSDGATLVGSLEELDAAEERSGAQVVRQLLAAVSVPGALLALWALGAAYLLARLSVSTLGAWWLVRRADPVADEALLKAAEAVRRDLGVTSPVRMVQSDRISMPMAWGILRPAILLPRQASEWSSERRRVVLLHEMAHLQRRDCLTLLLARLVTALHWFNPLSWTATRRLQAERERACDDLVLRSGTAGADYAQHLLDIARAVRRDRSPAWATVAMARPTELEGRLLAILDPSRRRSSAPRSITAAALLAVAGMVVPLAALQPSAVAQQQGDDEQAMELRIRREMKQAVAMRLAPRLQFDVSLKPRIDTALELALPHALETGLAAETASALGAELGAELAPELAAGLAGQDADAQSAEVSDRVIQAFATALADEDASIRSQAAHALGMMESDRAVEMLSAALRDDDDVGVRSQAAWALGMIESDAAVEVLSDALANDEDRVRKQAVWALGMIESSASVAPLSVALNDTDAEIRSQAAWALGMIESPEAVDALVSSLGDADEPVRSQAAWALGMIEDASAVEGLSTAVRNDDSAKVRRQAAWALGMIEDEGGLDALLDAMTDEDLRVRKTALWAVGHISG